MRVLVLASCSLLLSLGCGGSSSETPPPLEPDPESSRYTGPRFPGASDAAATTPAPTPDEDDAPVRPRKPAVSTWGSGRAAPPGVSAAPAPTMTSPNVAPSASSLPGALPSN